MTKERRAALIAAGKCAACARKNDRRNRTLCTDCANKRSRTKQRQIIQQRLEMP